MSVELQLASDNFRANLDWRTVFRANGMQTSETTGF
jgi:hypothetical protein